MCSSVSVRLKQPAGKKNREDAEIVVLASGWHWTVEREAAAKQALDACVGNKNMFADAAKLLQPSPDWPFAPAHLAYKLRLYYKKLNGLNKKEPKEMENTPAGSFSLTRLVTTAHDRVSRLAELERQWVAHIQSHYARSVEPKPIPILGYNVPNVTHKYFFPFRGCCLPFGYRMVVEHFKQQHLKRWTTDGVQGPKATTMADIPDEVLLHC